VSDEVTGGLARARNEIAAARTLIAAGFELQAISRAYYATFYAAEAALLTAGETRSKHSGVIAAFGRLVVKDGGFDPETGATLRELFRLRNAADYDWLEAEQVASEPVDDAARFVDAVEAWIQTQSASC
jgi:uncharacterized protein (UPF0332 family)